MYPCLLSGEPIPEPTEKDVTGARLYTISHAIGFTKAYNIDWWNEVYANVADYTDETIDDYEDEQDVRDNVLQLFEFKGKSRHMYQMVREMKRVKYHWKRLDMYNDDNYINPNECVNGSLEEWRGMMRHGAYLLKNEENEQVES